MYHTFVIEVDNRNEFREFLLSKGIGTQIHYPKPIHIQECAAELGYRRGDFPVSERQADRIVSLPVYPELNASELETVADGICDFF